MKTCKWRVVLRGLTLPVVVCFLAASVWAQDHARQTGPPDKDKAFKGLPNLLASNLNSKATDSSEKNEKAPAEKDPSEKDPAAKKDPATGGGSPAPTPAGAEDPPLGFAGPKTVKAKSPMVTDEQESGDFVPVDDRWRIGFPEWDRHGDFTKADYPYVKGRLINPYRQNVLKGDYPVFGTDKFFTLKLISETNMNFRRAPTLSDQSTRLPDGDEFFGRTGQFFLQQYFKIETDFFKGDASFKPADYRFHALVAFNVNYAHVRENGILRIDDRRGNTRRDGIIALQEAFAEYRLGDTPRFLPFLRGKGSRGGYSPFFDTTTLRAGIQCFNSDFRGFIYNDCNLGARLFGNFKANRYQFNLAYFEQLEKDTNSGLNTFDTRNQEVYIANLYRQDTIKKGYTIQFSYHHNRDNKSFHTDKNEFPVRPAVFGFAVPHEIRTHYIGFTTEGHFGERLPKILWLNKIGGGLNVSSSFYQILGKDSFNGLAGREVDVNAQLAAVELSVDRDWARFRASFLYASGDDDPTDGTARGFDYILDDNNFTGGKNSFFNSQLIPFLNTTTQLTTPLSNIPNLRSSKIEGQANHVNPGVFIYNVGFDADITQKLKVIMNANAIRFHHVEPLELALFQPQIEKFLGVEFSSGFKYRPKLNDNIILFFGASVFRPSAGFTSIFESNCNPAGPANCGSQTGNKTLFNLFTSIKFQY